MIQKIGVVVKGSFTFLPEYLTKRVTGQIGPLYHDHDICWKVTGVINFFENDTVFIRGSHGDRAYELRRYPNEKELLWTEVELDIPKSEDDVEYTHPQTLEEQAISAHIIAVWNSFIKLDDRRQDDTDDFRRSIHEIQRIMGLRILRRDHPEIYTPEESQ